jgi:hypothetical protein
MHGNTKIKKERKLLCAIRSRILLCSFSNLNIKTHTNCNYINCGTWSKPENTWCVFSILINIGRMWINIVLCLGWSTRWHSWSRHCAASRKVACSISDGVIGIFQWLDPSGRTVALRWLSLLQKWLTRIFTLPPSCVDCLEIWEP